MRPLFLLALLTIAASAAQAADLTITVVNAGPKGDVRVRLHDQPTGFPKDGVAVAQVVGRPVNGRFSMTLHDVPAGVYAVAAYQDVDGNQALTTNFMGFPSEPYGFSNNSRDADFEKAAVQVPQEGKTLVTVSLK